jgi:hypothetical protein
MDADWKALYRQRTAVERLNGRLKGFYKFDRYASSGTAEGHRSRLDFKH